MVAFESLIEIHYRFYQFYGNSLIAIPIFCGFRWWHVLPGWFEVFSAVFLWIIFFIGSRDTLHLCGQPHNLSYVFKLVMWRPLIQALVPSVLQQIERHITD